MEEKIGWEEEEEEEEEEDLHPHHSTGLQGPGGGEDVRAVGGHLGRSSLLVVSPPGTE